MARILAIDDERVILNLYETALGQLYEITTVENAEDGLDKLGSVLFDLVLLDINMPGISGIDLLKEIRRREHDCAVIIVTVHKSVETIVDAMRSGADDYLTKPFKIIELRHAVEKMLKLVYLERRARSLETSLLATDQRERIVYKSAEMQKVFDTLSKAAPADASILLTGESGTGKELAAQFVHEHSARSEGPLVAVNCAAIPATLLESELFGHEKGAFSGAVEKRIGKFEMANRGTLFLDEIGSLALDLQSKLLRVIETLEMERVGGTNPIHLDLRWIAATNNDPDELVRYKALREDLYFRLNVISVHIPPLRQRHEDVPLLTDYFLDRYAKEMKKPALKLSDGALNVFQEYEWPGNVRELKNLIERLTVLEPGPVVDIEDLPPMMIRRETERTIFEHVEPGKENFREAVDLFRKELIINALRDTGGNKVKAAKLLGLHRNTLSHHFKSLGIKPETYGQN